MTHKLSSVQSLRAVAAIAVVAYHSAATIKIFGWTPGGFADASGWGWAGVDIFFFISGFVMVMTTSGRRRGPQAARDFMASRITRIAPMYWILTSLMLVIVWAVPSLKNSDFTVMQIVTSYLFIPYEVKEHGNAYPVLYVGWTLTYEMFFYAVFALSILFSERRMRWALPAFFVVLSLLSLARPTPFLFRFLTDPLLLEFVLGCLFAWLYLSGFRISRLGSAALAAAGVIGFCVWTPASAMEHRLVYAGIPAALLVSVAVFWETADGWVAGSLLPGIGDSSYSLYLLQTFTIPAFARLLAAADKLRSLPGDLACFLLVAATVIVSVLVYRLVERRIDAKLRELRQNFRDIHVPGGGKSEEMATKPVQRD
ncbi:acyltransferase [Cupriavidus necator]|uniref:acyltransferase family protein n=1 Tax=Cupriavidus necator TaxID=106590 RepID=UPI0039C3C63C